MGKSQFDRPLSPERRRRFILLRGVIGFGGILFLVTTGLSFYHHRTFAGIWEAADLALRACLCAIAGWLWG